MIEILKFIQNFLNNNIGVVTFLVGFFAIFIYLKQKWDYKRDAASIILMEIRNAEKIIDLMKNHGVAISESMEKILPSNNWIKYNYLFIKNFDRDELDLVNNFYNQCVLVDSALSQLSISNQIEQKGGYIHNALVQIAKDAISDADFENKKTNFLKIIQNEPYVFKPDAPSQTVTRGLNNLSKITTTTAGGKLKKIAKLK